MSGATSRGELMRRLSDRRRFQTTHLYPQASIKLGPFWGVNCPIRLVAEAVPWPQELDGPDFTVTDPEPHLLAPDNGGPVTAARRAAITERIGLVARALDMEVCVSFQPAEGVALHPRQAPTPFDWREEQRIQNEEWALCARRAEERDEERQLHSAPARERLEGGRE